MEARFKLVAYGCAACKKYHHTLLLNAGLPQTISSCIGCNMPAVRQPRNFNAKSGNAIQFVWYRPQPDEFRRLEPATQSWVLKGGLLKGILGLVHPLDDALNTSWAFEQLIEFTKVTYRDHLPKGVCIECARVQMVARCVACREDFCLEHFFHHRCKRETSDATS